MADGGWEKFAGNPVLGGELGVCFDVSILRDAQAKPASGKYKMYFSWRTQKSVAVAESADGVHWGQPVILMAPRPQSGWEDEINRPVVIKKTDRYYMWYTGQVNPGAGDGHSWIGYAESWDGISWDRLDRPVLSFDLPWEKGAVMCPHVIWDESAKLYKMWYSGGEQYEPDAIGYAESSDGIRWKKYAGNPIFQANARSRWEHKKVTACQVVKHGGWYIMFYIGFENVELARIGIARSRDGITDWKRMPANPIIAPDTGAWDADACYKPFAVYDEESGSWTLWYNGRRGDKEQIGMAYHEGADLGFE